MAERAPNPAVDPVIQAECAFLTEARAALGRMHEDVVTTATVQDSSEDADYTFANRELTRDRERRAESLVDFSDVPLFFGRLDYPPGGVYEAAPGESPSATRGPDADHVYIGRRRTRGSLTVLGDIAQGTNPWAVDDWPRLLAHLGQTEDALEAARLVWSRPPWPRAWSSTPSSSPNRPASPRPNPAA